MAVPNSLQRKQMNGQSQKPTGMLWGANSQSVKKRKYPDSNAFGDFGKYMAEKKRKLSIQFQVEATNKDTSTVAPAGPSSSSCHAELSIGTIIADTAASCGDLTKLFFGISIFVDGFTKPSHQELRNLMIKHGGMFENYFSRDVVTHIICSTLPDSKIRDHRSFSRGVPIVKPSWIVDSILYGKVLPIALYSHERIARSHPNQCTMLAFLKHDPNKHLDHVGIPSLSQPISYLQAETAPEKPMSVCYNPEALERRQEQVACQSPLKPSPKSDVNSTKELECVKSHCSLGDANFVHNYFKNSRLHFIGTWRTRYQNRFQGTKMDIYQPHEKPNISTISSDCGNRIIMHIDMDCFFVAVVVRNRPELCAKPVAVCHSEKTQGTAEISSSNYAARAFGIKSGMFIRDAKALCPDLEIVPYDFDGYGQVADQFYDVLHKYCNKVQAISCDEAYLDVTGVENPEVLASNIRKEIVELTRCTASVGIGGNLLLARMATRRAKPDGQFRIAEENVEEFLSGLLVEDLPGVGWSLQEKLFSKSIYSCMQLRGVPKEALQKELGLKTGDMLWCYARGIDNRQVQNYQERKSIGAEVNWGVRFHSASDAQHFLASLCEEVSTRLQNALVIGRTFTLKIKKRKEGAGEPQKFMGCGSCDNLSKSITLGYPTNTIDVLLRASRQLFLSFHLDVREIRGMGLQVTKLKSNITVSSEEGQHHQKGLESCLQFLPKKGHDEILSEADNLFDVSNDEVFTRTKKSPDISKEDAIGVTPWGIGRSQMKGNKGMLSLGKVRKGPFSGILRAKEKERKNLSSAQNLPQFSELDHSVLVSLPPDILAELDEAYNGALAQGLLSSQNPEATTCTAPLISRSLTQGGEPLLSNFDGLDANKFQIERDKCSSALENILPICRMEEPNRAGERDETSCAGSTRLYSEPSIPFSVSQLDMETLEELPTQLREDVLRSLRGRQSENQGNKHDTRTAEMNDKSLSISLVEITEPSNSPESALRLDCLWSGAPPKWVSLFKELQGAKSEILHLLCIAFLEVKCPEKLSSMLLHAMNSPKFSVHGGGIPADSIAVTCCLELLKQYVTLKMSCDLEEVFLMARVMKRLAGKNQFWERIYDSIIPVIQAAAGESYGGALSMTVQIFGITGCQMDS